MFARCDFGSIHTTRVLSCYDFYTYINRPASIPHTHTHTHTHTCTQAVALQKLNHPYICGYREFFVIWDQEVLIYATDLKKKNKKKTFLF